MLRRWTEAQDTAVRLADSLDYTHGGCRLAELAARFSRTEPAVRQRASKLRLQRPCQDPAAVAADSGRVAADRLS